MTGKHFSLLVPQNLIIIGVITSVSMLGVWRLTVPQRTLPNYCKTFYTEGKKLHQQWAQQQKQTGNELFDSLSMLAGAPGDLSVYFDKLSKVAPKEIEPDLVRISDAYKKSTDTKLPTSFTSGFVGLIENVSLGLSIQGSMSRVVSYTSTNCKSYRDQIIGEGK